MDGAGAAGSSEFAAESGTGAVGADGGVAGGEFVAVGEVGEGCVGEIDFAEDLGVGGAEGGEDDLDAAADEGASGDVGGGGLGVGEVQLGDPAIHRGGLGGVMAVVIDDGVAQDCVEPGDGRFVLAESSGLFERADVGDLQDVFCKRAVVDATLHEGKEALAAVEESLEGEIGHREVQPENVRSLRLRMINSWGRLGRCSRDRCIRGRRGSCIGWSWVAPFKDRERNGHWGRRMSGENITGPGLELWMQQLEACLELVGVGQCDGLRVLIERR